MDLYWTCSECGSANKYPDISKCEVCGKTIEELEKKAVANTINTIKKNIAEEKTRDDKQRLERKKAEKEFVKQKQQKVIIQNSNAIKKVASPEPLKKEKIKWGTIIPKFFGIVLLVSSVVFCIASTIIIKQNQPNTAGWTFFLIAAIISAAVSAFFYLYFNEEKGNIYEASYIVFSGFIGAFIIACTISDGWESTLADIWDDGFLAIVFLGWLALVFFLFIVALSVIITVVVTQVLPAYLMKFFKENGWLGGLIGIGIDLIIGSIFLYFCELDGVRIVAGYLFNLL